MSETLQIVATLAAAEIVLTLAPDAVTRRVAAAGLGRRDAGTAFLVGRWLAGLLAAALALATLGSLVETLPAAAPLLALLGAVRLAVLGIAAVRRAFADADALAPPPPIAAAGALRHGFRSTLAAPATAAWWLAAFAVTGAWDLDASARLVVVLALPSLAAAWTALRAHALRADPAAPPSSLAV